MSISRMQKTDKNRLFLPPFLFYIKILIQSGKIQVGDRGAKIGFPIESVIMEIRMLKKINAQGGAMRISRICGKSDVRIAVQRKNIKKARPLRFCIFLQRKGKGILRSKGCTSTRTAPPLPSEGRKIHLVRANLHVQAACIYSHALSRLQRREKITMQGNGPIRNKASESQEMHLHIKKSLYPML